MTIKPVTSFAITETPYPHNLGSLLEMRLKIPGGLNN